MSSFDDGLHSSHSLMQSSFVDKAETATRNNRIDTNPIRKHL